MDNRIWYVISDVLNEKRWKIVIQRTPMIALGVSFSLSLSWPRWRSLHGGRCREEITSVLVLRGPPRPSHHGAIGAPPPRGQHGVVAAHRRHLLGGAGAPVHAVPPQVILRRVDGDGPVGINRGPRPGVVRSENDRRRRRRRLWGPLQYWRDGPAEGGRLLGGGDRCRCWALGAAALGLRV